jgi:5-carboxymethyl-2-hydroxymuconate isomerase
MPHIIVEHTENNALNIKSLNENLHKCLSEQETVSLESIKTRSIKVENAIVADGANNHFVHVNILLLKGRDEELKTKMAENIYKCAKDCLGNLDIKLSVNIDELGVYKK